MQEFSKKPKKQANDIEHNKKPKLTALMDLGFSKTKCENSKCEICVLESFLDENWTVKLKSEFSKPYFANIKATLHAAAKFYPRVHHIFAFANYCKFSEVKVVIIGQDPYHNEGQAMGLSFSVPKKCSIPPSLKNIYTELKNDIKDFVIPEHGDLSKWARQGVLLLNDSLTVLSNQPSSHAKIGWKNFTLAILESINRDLDGVVFILWGNHAREKKGMLDATKHLILEAGHPSPFSVKYFFGSKHFSKANDYLKLHGKTEIDWQL